MELLPEHFLRHADSPTPALNRGLALLVLLEREAPASLETLAGKLRLPKSSVFRLLETLGAIGLIQKNPNKSYEALCRLQPLREPGILFRQNLEPKMRQLSERIASTVEWYEPSAEGMRLVLQQNPDSELFVRAKPGFLRTWSTEFEAVARLGCAFAPNVAEIRGSRRFVENGRVEKVSKTEARSLIEEARRAKSAWDEAYNEQGVRRFAVAAFDPSTRFLGVLAAAEVHRFSPSLESNDLLNQLKQTLH